MPRKDTYHDVVRTALKKDGWQVIDDPLRIVAGGVGLFIDLSAEPIMSAEREGRRIAIEIKSFEIQSQITSFYEAFGKYLTYEKALSMNKMSLELYCFHIEIINNKVWVHENNTEALIADELIEKGVDAEDIILGFIESDLPVYQRLAVA